MNERTPSRPVNSLADRIEQRLRALPIPGTQTVKMADVISREMLRRISEEAASEAAGSQ